MSRWYHSFISLSSILNLQSLTKNTVSTEKVQTSACSWFRSNNTYRKSHITSKAPILFRITRPIVQLVLWWYHIVVRQTRLPARATWCVRNTRYVCLGCGPVLLAADNGTLPCDCFGFSAYISDCQREGIVLKRFGSDKIDSLRLKRKRKTERWQGLRRQIDR